MFFPLFFKHHVVFPNQTDYIGEYDITDMIEVSVYLTLWNGGMVYIYQVKLEEHLFMMPALEYA